MMPADLLAKVAEIMHEPVAGAYFHRDELGDPTSLSWQGRYAIVLRLLEEGCGLEDHGVMRWDGARMRTVLMFAQPGKPTPDELMRALVEVCG